MKWALWRSIEEVSNIPTSLIGAAIDPINSIVGNHVGQFIDVPYMPFSRIAGSLKTSYLLVAGMDAPVCADLFLASKVLCG